MPCPINRQPDPFGEAHRKDGILRNEFEGKPVPMILRRDDLRTAARNWPSSRLGAPQARLVVRSILKGFCERVARLETLLAVEKVEPESRYNRTVAYESLQVRLFGR